MSSSKNPVSLSPLLYGCLACGSVSDRTQLSLSFVMELTDEERNTKTAFWLLVNLLNF